MSVRIDCLYKNILQCQNRVFDSLYENILDILEREGLELDEKLLEKLEVATYGVGFDVAEYIQTKDQIDSFIKLVREAVEEYERNFTGFLVDVMPSLWIFYAELLRYAESLEGHPGFVDMIKLDENEKSVWYRFEHDISSDENKSQEVNVFYGYCKFNKETGEFELDKEKTDSYFLNKDNAIVNSARDDLLTVKRYNLYYPTKNYKHY